MSSKLAFCPNCGRRLRIYKKRNKTDYYYRCRNCRINFELKDKIVLVRASERKNARKKRMLLENIPKIQHEKDSIVIIEQKDDENKTK
jgi:DNA-directed RNA polymerase subunit M/transcription elongation factor TFIIS